MLEYLSFFYFFMTYDYFARDSFVSFFLQIACVLRFFNIFQIKNAQNRWYY